MDNYESNIDRSVSSDTSVGVKDYGNGRTGQQNVLVFHEGLTTKIVSLLDCELSNINRVIKRTLNRALY